MFSREIFGDLLSFWPKMSMKFAEFDKKFSFPIIKLITAFFVTL